MANSTNKVALGHLDKNVNPGLTEHAADRSDFLPANVIELHRLRGI